MTRAGLCGLLTTRIVHCNRRHSLSMPPAIMFADGAACDVNSTTSCATSTPNCNLDTCQCACLKPNCGSKCCPGICDTTGQDCCATSELAGATNCMGRAPDAYEGTSVTPAHLMPEMQGCMSCLALRMSLHCLLPPALPGAVPLAATHRGLWQHLLRQWHRQLLQGCRYRCRHVLPG